MPAKITFTQAEQDYLQTWLDTHDSGAHVFHKPFWSLLAKMKAARDKEDTKFHGVSVAKVLDMSRVKFGERFKTPNLITTQWIIKMQKAINDAGVTEATAQTAINNCDWTGDIYAQNLIYKLAELAVVAPRQTKMFKQAGPAAPTKKSGWLGRLDDE